MNIIEATPKFLVTLLILLLTLPALSMILGFDLGFSTHLHDKPQFYYLLYRWTILIISLLILLLSILNYSLSGNEIIYTIGIASIFSVYFNLFITASYKWIYGLTLNAENLHAYFWIFSNTILGLIIGVGLTLLIFTKKTKILHTSQLLLTAFLLGITSYWLYTVIFNHYQPEGIIYPNQIIEYPFAVLNFIIYGYIFSLYFYFKDKISLLSSRLFFLLGLTQCGMSFYVMFGIMKRFDASLIGSSFLQLLSYLYILIFISRHYFYSYRQLVIAQNEIKQDKERFEKLSYEDPLTALANRRALEVEGERVLARAQRDQNQATIVFLDIDNFKDINDQLSHDVGDKILQQIAGRLNKSLRINDFCARLGGDEFVIIFYDSELKGNIDIILSKISTVLNQAYYVDGRKIIVKISLGVAVYPKDGQTLSALINTADKAMYQNKRIN